MRVSIGLLVGMLMFGGSGTVQAAESLRFAPPLKYAQDFDAEVDGKATARGRDVSFVGELDFSQRVVEVPASESDPLTVELTINGGSIRYRDRDKPPRYIGEPFRARRTRLGAIVDVSEPLDDAEDIGIDVTAAVLYATSLLVFPERDARPGESWDGSHEAFDPFGDYVPVTARNTFADLLELPDRTLVRVDSEGSFPYRAKIDEDWLYGTLSYFLEMTIDQEHGTVVEADLLLYGELKTKAFVTVNIKVHRLHVHVTERAHGIREDGEPPTPSQLERTSERPVSDSDPVSDESGD